MVIVATSKISCIMCSDSDGEWSKLNLGVVDLERITEYVIYIYFIHSTYTQIYYLILRDAYCLLPYLYQCFFWQFFSADRIKVSIQGFFWKDWSMDLERQQP